MKKELSKKNVNGLNSAAMYISPRACYCYQCPCSCSSAKVTVNNSGYTKDSAAMHSASMVG